MLFRSEFFQLGCEGLQIKTIVLYCLSLETSSKTYAQEVNAKNDRLSGLKSHDCHVLLQRILPIGLRGFANKDNSIVLFKFGNFFQDLCSRTRKRSELEKLEERIVFILCKLKRFLSPAFFDVMVHLAAHLSQEAILGGPVQYQWMYPIERQLDPLMHSSIASFPRGIKSHSMCIFSS